MNSPINRQQFKEKLENWQEILTKHKECGGCQAELLGNVISMLDAFPAADNQDGCGWCKPSRDGNYTMAMFQNPNDPGTSAMLGVYGGKIVLELTLPGEEAAHRLSCKINHCPFCGRAYMEEET